MSRGIRSRARRVSATLVVILLLGMVPAAPAFGENKYNRHWRQDPDGSLIRWVSYHEHLPETKYGTWMAHTMGHYYDAPNRWRPYQVSPDTLAQISADNEYSDDV